MRLMKQPILSIAAIAVVAVLAGCAGGSSAPAVSNAIPQGVSQPPPAGVSNGKCGHDHGVSVKPCKVTLTVANPTATVTTKGPSGGTFTVRDNRCSAKNIATVAGVGNTYTVTAGTSTGTCGAKFIDKDVSGHVIGVAQLSITNQI
jgi:hypothetical protein